MLGALDADREFICHLAIAWGMNNSRKRPAGKYVKDLEVQVKIFRKRRQNVDFLVVLSSRTNDLWSAAHPEYLLQYERVILEKAIKWRNDIQLVNMTRLLSELLERKDYYDLAGNGLHHPNDFRHALYCNAIVDVL